MNPVHCTFISIFLWTSLIRVFRYTIILYQVFLSDINNLYTVLWFLTSYLKLSLSIHPYHTPLPAGLAVDILFRTDLLWVSSCWSDNTVSSIPRGLQQNVTHQFILASPAVPCVSFLSYLDVLEIGGKWPNSCCSMVWLVDWWGFMAYQPL